MCKWDFGLNNHQLEVQLRPPILPYGLFNFNSPSSVLNYSGRGNDPAHSSIYTIPPSTGGRRWLGSRLCHARGFSWGFQPNGTCRQQRAASSALVPAVLQPQPVTPRPLADTGSFYFKNSIWLACYQGCYSTPQPPSAAAPGSFSRIYPNSALLGFSERYLNFIHKQAPIYRTIGHSKRSRCQSEVKKKR